jgi:hypothetical protein
LDELMRLGHEEAVLKQDRPIVYGAAAELPSAFIELRRQLGFDEGRIGIVGGSIGAAVAELVLAEG